MKRINLYPLILILLLACTLGCTKKSASHDIQEGEEPARKEECPDTISAFGDTRFQNQVFRGSFSPDGSTFYFFKKIDPQKEEYRIYQSSKDGEKWSDPQLVHLGGDYSDLYPSISKDGKRMVFSSYRPVPKEYQSTDAKNAHLWYSEKKPEGWGAPIFMASVNEVGHYHSWVEFGWDDKIYFRRVSPDWTFKQTLYTEWDGAKYAAPKIFNEVEQWTNWSPDVQIAGGSPGPTKDLVFLDVATYDTKTGNRGSDIWVAVKNKEVWEAPVPLAGNVNQDGYDVFPFFSPDGDCMYFVRDFNNFYRVALKEVIPETRF